MADENEKVTDVTEDDDQITYKVIRGEFDKVMVEFKRGKEVTGMMFTWDGKQTVDEMIAHCVPFGPKPKAGVDAKQLIGKSGTFQPKTG